MLINGEVGDGTYFLTAFAGDEKSFENELDDKTYGVFTSVFCRGCGYDCFQEKRIKIEADINDDKRISFREVFVYTKRMLLPENQHVTAYPKDCELILFAE